MLDFDKWFAQQGKTAPTPPPQPDTEPEWPEGVWQRNGKWVAECRACGSTYELPIDPIEDGFDQDMSYCGGSMYCIP